MLNTEQSIEKKIKLIQRLKNCIIFLTLLAQCQVATNLQLNIFIVTEVHRVCILLRFSFFFIESNVIITLRMASVLSTIYIAFIFLCFVISVDLNMTRNDHWLIICVMLIFSNRKRIQLPMSTVRTKWFSWRSCIPLCYGMTAIRND